VIAAAVSHPASASEDGARRGAVSDRVSTDAGDSSEESEEFARIIMYSEVYLHSLSTNKRE
jgi:hypothetical protein